MFRLFSYEQTKKLNKLGFKPEINDDTLYWCYLANYKGEMYWSGPFNQDQGGFKQAKKTLATFSESDVIKMLPQFVPVPANVAVDILETDLIYSIIQKTKEQ